MQVIDYVRELERLEAQQGWIICQPAIIATRRLRFPTPHLARCMGDVWNALDAWIVAGRPLSIEWRPSGRDTPERRLAHALVRMLVADAWYELTSGDL